MFNYKNNLLYKFGKHEFEPNYDRLLDECIRLRQSLKAKALMAHMCCVVSSSIDKPIIGTQALDTCHDILFYDRIKRFGVVGHVTSGYKGILNEMLAMFEDGQNHTIEYMIIPGYRIVEKADYRTFSEILYCLKSYGNPQIVFVPLKNYEGGIKLHKSTLTYEFAFNTADGNFVSNKLFFDIAEHDPRRFTRNRKF